MSTAVVQPQTDQVALIFADVLPMTHSGHVLFERISPQVAYLVTKQSLVYQCNVKVGDFSAKICIFVSFTKLVHILYVVGLFDT